MASEIKVDTIVNAGGDNDSGIDLATNDNIKFDIAGSQKAMIDSSGNVLVNGSVSNPAFSNTANQIALRGSVGTIEASRDGGAPLELNRKTSDGVMVNLRKDGSVIGTIGVNGEFFIAHTSTGIKFVGNNVVPTNSAGATADNDKDIGSESVRFVDIHATNGTIQTSDQNEKQDTASLTSKELNVAKKLSALFKTFRWKDKVAEKGDKARTHTGIIAQEVQSAFNAEGLDASKYGLFISGTYKDEDGKEQTRLGVRYAELFSFIFSSIEARLTALESK